MPLSTAAGLKAAFDASFALALETDDDAGEVVLRVEANGSVVAVLAREVAFVTRCPPLTRVPSPDPALLGLAGVRGEVVAVHGLGQSPGSTSSGIASGWLLVSARDRASALWVERVLGQSVVALSPEGAGHELVRVDQADLRIIRMARVLDLEHRTPRATASKDEDT